jgi:mRNA interferase RelE/StbE
LAWTVSWTTEAQDSLAKLDRQIARRIRAYFIERVAPLENPRTLGKPLRGELREYWRYRIGDYRAVCEIRDQAVVIVVVFVDHRKDVYR